MDAVRRYPGNPVLTKESVPYPAELVFNAGVTKYQGRYIMVFRNDYGDARTKRLKGINLGLATSGDGVHWEVADKPCFSLRTDEIRCAYDPRLTVIDGKCYMCFAVDTRHGIRGGVAVTEDLEHFEVLSLSAPDNRNMVLFPERREGMFMRLERPFPIYGRYGAGTGEDFDIWFSDSPDCRYWGNNRLVLGAEEVPFTNSKIGPGPPPVRTERGWLVLFHAVIKHENDLDAWHPGWRKEYVVGAMLLDIDRPWRVIGFTPEPIMRPESDYPYEMTGYRGRVIFPGGLILEDDGQVKIYYGAADTVECLATCRLDDLLAAVKPLQRKEEPEPFDRLD